MSNDEIRTNVLHSSVPSPKATFQDVILTVCLAATSLSEIVCFPNFGMLSILPVGGTHSTAVKLMKTFPTRGRRDKQKCELSFDEEKKVGRFRYTFFIL